MKKKQSDKIASFLICIKITNYNQYFQKTTKNYLQHGNETVL